ncbi:MAG: DinB family protein [Acidimicrobiales bacterium]
MTILRAWLTHLRGSAEYKLEGLSYEQLRWTPTPTANSLGGIVLHLGYGERFWIRAVFTGEQTDLSWTNNRYAPTFAVPDGWGVDELVAFYKAETANVDQVLDGVYSLDLRSKATIRPTTLRWILTHLVEETARHVGHMDLTRELIDGSIGR